MAGKSTKVAFLTIAASSIALSGCSDLSWDRSYNLRQWEKIRLTAEADFLAGEYKPAEQLLNDALSYAEKLGAGNFRVAVTLSQSGDVLMRDGKPDAARAVYVKSLAVLSKDFQLAKTDYDRRFFQESLIKVLMNLGEIELRAHNAREAEGYFEKVLALYRQWGESAGSRVFAEDFGRAFAGEALVKASGGDKAEANRLVKEALAAPAASYYSHGLTEQLNRLAAGLSASRKQDVQNLGKSDEQFRYLVLSAKQCESSKDYAGAERQYALAVEEGLKAGVDERTLCGAYYKLGDCQARLMQQADSVRSYRCALACLDKSGGKLDSQDEEKLEKLLGKLGQACLELGDDRDAIVYFKRQLEMRKLSYGPDSGQVGETLAYLAGAELSMGASTGALRDARAARLRLKGSPFKRVLVALANEELAIVFFALEKYDEARAANQDVLDMYEGAKVPRARRLLTLFRAAALAAAEGNSTKSNSAAQAAISDATSCLSGTNEWQKLLDFMTRDAKFLSGHGQSRAGAMMSEWKRQLEAK